MKTGSINVLYFLSSLIFIYSIIPHKTFASGFRFKENCSVVEIPFQFMEGMVIIPISINGSENLNFMLDTGARSMILFSKKYAEKLDLKKDKKIAFSGVGNNNFVEAFVSYEQKVSLPCIEASNIAITTLKKSLTKLTTKKIHGAIGYQIFAQFIVKIDYNNMLLTLYDKLSFTPEPNYDYVSLTIEDTKPYITSDICTGEYHLSLKLMIDTGFNKDLLLFPTKNTSSWISETSSGTSDIIGFGLGGPINGSTLYNVVVHINNNTISVMDVLTTNVVPVENDFTKLDGLLGNQVMNNFSVVVFDYAGGKVYFNPTDNSNYTTKRIHFALVNN